MNGQRSIYYKEMIILAPETFSYGNPEKLPKKDWWAAYDKDNIIGTLQWYEDKAKAVGRWTYGSEHLKFYNGVVNTNSVEITTIKCFPEPVGCIKTTEFIKADNYNGKNWTKFFKDVLTKGLAQKDYLDALSKSQEETWSDPQMKLLWDDYYSDVGGDEPDERKRRNAWSFIKLNSVSFLEELQQRTRTMQDERREKLMDEYRRITTGIKDPLDLPAAKRAYFMGQLNNVAFDNKPEFSAEDLIKKNFGSLKENILVSHNKSHAKGQHWDKKVKTYIKLPATEKDYLNIRIFVTDKPTTIIVIFEEPHEGKLPDQTKGTVGLFNSMSRFLEYKPNKFNEKDSTGYIPDIKELSFPATVNFDYLENSDNVMQIFEKEHEIWLKCKDEIISIIEGLSLSYSGTTDIFLTGYGVGAQLAQIAALYIPRLAVRKFRIDSRFKKTSDVVSFKNPHCYLFASPAVGDRRFNIIFNALTEEVIHVWTDGDLVVQMPPVIIPNIFLYNKLYLKTVATIQLMVSQYPSFAGELFLLSEAFGFETGNFSYLSLLDDPVSKKYFDSYTIENLHTQMGNIVKANVNFQAYRGGGVFLRLNESGAGAFETNVKDPLNSAKALSHLVDNDETKKHLTRIHSLPSILLELQYELQHHSEDFVIDDKKMADWGKHGEINGKPHPDDDFPKHLPQWLIDLLLKGEAHIVGYAHSRHFHKEGTIVPKADVDEYVNLPNRYDPLTLERERQWSHNKRQKINSSTEGDYHGSYY
jgi:hypothetical protein